MSCPPVSCLLPAVPTKDVIITLFCLCFTRQECLENVSSAGTPCNPISSVRYYHHTETSASSQQCKLQTEQNSPAKHFTSSLPLCLSVSRFICNFLFSPAKTSTLLKTLMYIFISVKWFVRIRDTVLNLRKMEARKCY